MPTRLLVKYKEQGGVFTRGATMGVRATWPDKAGKGGHDVVDIIDGSTAEQKRAQLEQDPGGCMGPCA